MMLTFLYLMLIYLQRHRKICCMQKPSKQSSLEEWFTRLIRTGGIRMDLLVQYKWGIFITLEVLSIVSLLVFCGVRYFLDKRKLSNLFIFLFLFFLFLEALLALLI